MSALPQLDWQQRVEYSRTLPGDERRVYELDRPFKIRWPVCVVQRPFVSERWKSLTGHNRPQRHASNSGRSAARGGQTEPLIEPTKGSRQAPRVDRAEKSGSRVSAQANRIGGIESASALWSTLAPDPQQHETHNWNCHCSAGHCVTGIRANDVPLPRPRPNDLLGQAVSQR
jgi:hypothetical protein